MLFPRPFSFIDHPVLVDRELQLVAPHARWKDEFLRSVRHPATVAAMPREARLNREELDQFLAENPDGRHPGVPDGRAPSYQFWMFLHHAADCPDQPPPLRIAGGLSLRIGGGTAIECFYGHVGYHVYPPAQGNHYALRACRLILPLARAHGLQTLWLTCNPDNQASRRTIEQLGGVYVETVAVPPDEPLFLRGETAKSRFRLAL